MLEIPLGKNKFALIDNDDLELVMRYKWYFYKSNFGKSGYATASRYYMKSTPIFMHTLLMNTPKGFSVDHINGNGLDNRRSNLRICTHAENMKNKRKINKLKSSYYKGVQYNKKTKKYHSQIIVNGKSIWLGYYDKESEAAIAYNKAAIKYNAEYANTNEIIEETKLIISFGK